jgi:hypothetical protein
MIFINIVHMTLEVISTSALFYEQLNHHSDSRGNLYKFTIFTSN